jgi:type IV secretory pathway VirB3-like protein
MTLQDYSLPVHKSMHQPDLLMGIPKMILAIILCVTIIFIYLLGFSFGFIGIILYIPCCIISKDDPFMLTIALESVFQIDRLEG